MNYDTKHEVIENIRDNIDSCHATQRELQTLELLSIIAEALVDIAESLKLRTRQEDRTYR